MIILNFVIDDATALHYFISKGEVEFQIFRPLDW